MKWSVDLICVALKEHAQVILQPLSCTAYRAAREEHQLTAKLPGWCTLYVLRKELEKEGVRFVCPPARWTSEKLTAALKRHKRHLESPLTSYKYEAARTKYNLRNKLPAWETVLANKKAAHAAGFKLKVGRSVRPWKLEEMHKALTKCKKAIPTPITRKAYMRARRSTEVLRRSLPEWSAVERRRTELQALGWKFEKLSEPKTWTTKEIVDLLLPHKNALPKPLTGSAYISFRKQRKLEAVWPGYAAIERRIDELKAHGIIFERVKNRWPYQKVKQVLRKHRGQLGKQLIKTRYDWLRASLSDSETIPAWDTILMNRKALELEGFTFTTRGELRPPTQPATIVSLLLAHREQLPGVLQQDRYTSFREDNGLVEQLPAWRTVKANRDILVGAGFTFSP